MLRLLSAPLQGLHRILGVYSEGGGNDRTEASKVSAVQEWPPCRSIKDVRAFLGLTGFYRRFIKGYAVIAKPLTDLLKKDSQFQWMDKQQTAFEALSSALSSAPLLATPNRDKGYVVNTDASGYAVGAVLSQEQEDGRVQPLAFLSHKLEEVQQRWPVNDREMYAIYYAFSKWRRYLHHHKTLVYTDHQALRYFATQPNLSNRQMRWMQELAEYVYEIRYQPGTQNNVADALLRRSDMELSTLSASQQVSNCQQFSRMRSC